MVGVALVRVCCADAFSFVVYGGVLSPPFLIAADCIVELIQECIPICPCNVLTGSITYVRFARVAQTQTFVKRGENASTSPQAAMAVVFQEPMV